MTQQYYPTAWMDEVIGEPRDTPSEFLSLQSGKWFLFDPDGERPLLGPLLIGALVDFDALDDYGHHKVTIDETGTIVSAPTWPASANCFILDDEHYTLMGTAEECIRATHRNEPLEPGEHDLWVYEWQTRRFVFQIFLGVGEFHPAPEGATDGR